MARARRPAEAILAHAILATEALPLAA